MRMSWSPFGRVGWLSGLLPPSKTRCLDSTQGKEPEWGKSRNHGETFWTGTSRLIRKCNTKKNYLNKATFQIKQANYVISFVLTGNSDCPFLDQVGPHLNFTQWDNPPTQCLRARTILGELLFCVLCFKTPWNSNQLAGNNFKLCGQHCNSKWSEKSFSAKGFTTFTCTRWRQTTKSVGLAESRNCHPANTWFTQLR